MILKEQRVNMKLRRSCRNMCLSNTDIFEYFKDVSVRKDIKNDPRTDKKCVISFTTKFSPKTYVCVKMLSNNLTKKVNYLYIYTFIDLTQTFGLIVS